MESVVDATAEEIKVDLTQEGENVVATVLDAQTTQTPEDGEIPNTDEILPSQTLPQGDEAPQTGGIL